jgi:hypothetical protein
LAPPESALVLPFAAQAEGRVADLIHASAVLSDRVAALCRAAAAAGSRRLLDALAPTATTTTFSASFSLKVVISEKI